MRNLLKIGFIAMIVGLLTTQIGNRDAAAQDAEELMKKSHLAFYYFADDGATDVDMTIINKKGKERKRSFVMLRKDIEEGGDQKYYTYFSEPNDVSRMTFMVWKNAEKDDDRWIFIPALDLIKRIAAKDKNSSFVGSDFSYEDVSGRHWTEDSHELIGSGSDKVGENDVWVVKSTPKSKKSSKFLYKVSYLDKVRSIPLKEEYYNKKEKVEKTFMAEQIEEIDGFHIPMRRIMEDVKKNNKTIVQFSNIRLNTGIEEKIFTERYLRRPPKEYIK